MKRSTLILSLALFAGCTEDECPAGAVCIDDPPPSVAVQDGAWSLRLSRVEAMGDCAVADVEGQVVEAWLDAKADGGVVMDVQGLRLLGRQDGDVLFVEGSPDARPVPVAEEEAPPADDGDAAALCEDGDDPATGGGGGSSPGNPGGGSSGGGGSSPGHPGGGGGGPPPDAAPWLTIDATVLSAEEFAGELRMTEGRCEIVADVHGVWLGEVVVAQPGGGATEPSPGGDAVAENGA